jgi:hypothetical protein
VCVCVGKDKGKHAELKFFMNTLNPVHTVVVGFAVRRTLWVQNEYGILTDPKIMLKL